MEAIKKKLEDAGLWDATVEQELKALWKYGIQRISNYGVRQSVIDFLFEEAPLSFFVNPASPSKKHHPAWQNKKAGILRNTTECCLAIDMQLASYKKFCDHEDNVLAEPRDIVIAATILSDTYKYDKEILNGVEMVSEGKVNKSHGIIAAECWIKYRRRYEISGPVAHEIYLATYWHLGRWTPGWTDITKLPLLTDIVHRIDAAFADKSLELLYSPKRKIK